MSRYILVLISFIWFNCEDNVLPDEIELDWKNLDLSKDFETGRVDANGINTNQLESGVKTLKGLNNFYAIAIVYKGRLIVEEYKYGSENNKYAVYSVTKSVLSALVGQAVDKGLILDHSEMLGKYYPTIGDSIKQSITIGQLLTMSSGIPDFLSYIDDSYPLKQIMDYDLHYKPGTSWNYTSAGTHVLSYIFSAATKNSASLFGQKHFFPHLGIYDYFWFEDSKGVSNGGFGLYLKVVDMVKFGQLYLQNGRSANKQIISTDWVKNSSKMVVPFNEDKTDGYGLLWWVFQYGDELIYQAIGYGGQYITIVPSRGLTTAITSRPNSEPAYRTDLNNIYINKIFNSFSRVD
tara:strand:+ start:32094 stop:33140 length:1047 start_codon:yes stop_codon:yes gene_type:complete